MYKYIVALTLAVFAYADEKAIYAPCHAELAEIEKYIADMTELHGLPPIGVLKPQCLDDGTYAPKQCLGGVCRCVSAGGKKLTKDISRGLDRDMHCKCARALNEYKELGIVGRFYYCDEFGNYEARQCIGSRCFCVDPIFGKPAGDANVPIQEMMTLQC